MLKKTVMFAAVVALLFALAPPAQAELLNGSFESPDLFGTGSGANADDWVMVEPKGGDTILLEGRWDPTGGGADNAGPTDGVQVLGFGDRGGTYVSSVKQMIGTVDDLGFSLGADLTFGVRLGSATGANGGENSEAVTTIWRAFWEVNGVRQSGSQFATNLGSLAEGRLISNWSELVALGALNDPNREVSSANMTQVTVALDITGLLGTDELTVGFEYDRDAADTSNYNSRVFIDNVSAEIPEPATMSLLALGGLAFIRRRRRS